MGNEKQESFSKYILTAIYTTQIPNKKDISIMDIKRFINDCQKAFQSEIRELKHREDLLNFLNFSFLLLEVQRRRTY